MLAELLSLFLAPTIQIEVDPELFVFRRGEKIYSTEPCLHISGDEVLAIGDRYEGTRPAQAVHLFRLPLHHLGGTKPLESLLRHGIYTVSRHGLLFRRPRLHFVVSANMVRFTSGFHDAIFMSAALSSILRKNREYVTIMTQS